MLLLRASEMKTRITITSVDVADYLFYVQEVMKEGFISENNACYCSLTLFCGGVRVSCEKTKSGFSFRVWKQ